MLKAVFILVPKTPGEQVTFDFWSVLIEIELLYLIVLKTILKSQSTAFF